MTINRNNYESFFLLAVDNELSALEKNMLDEFLNNNTDLQKEFSLLQESILPAEDIIFKDKKYLLKTESIPAAMEEKLLLFLDNELSENEVHKFKLAILNDDKIRTEIELLQQTKLLPDTKIIFANKKLLYKKETGKVIPLNWLKFAAAVFIGFGVWGAIKYLPFVSKFQANNVAVEGSLPNKVSKQLAEINSITAPVPQETKITKNLALTKEHTIAKIIIKPSLQIPKKQGDLKANKIFTTEQKLSKPDNNLPKPYYEKANSRPGSNNQVNTIDNSTINDITFNKNPEKNIGTTLQSKIYTTSFTETNKEDQFTFSDDEEEPKKSRISGFLRKAKRVLERNTRIKASNENLKVANFEFATQ